MHTICWRFGKDLWSFLYGSSPYMVLQWSNNNTRIEGGMTINSYPNFCKTWWPWPLTSWFQSGTSSYMFAAHYFGGDAWHDTEFRMLTLLTSKGYRTNRESTASSYKETVRTQIQLIQWKTALSWFAEFRILPTWLLLACASNYGSICTR